MSTDQASSRAPGWAPARGTRDLTQGPITRTLMIFSLPMLGGNVLQSMNGTVNQIWVSHTLGESAIAALGNANIVMMLMLSAIFGVNMAANILIGQAVGRADPALVKKVMGTAITFFFALSTGVALLGGWLTPHILDLMRTPRIAHDEAVIYLRIIFAAAPFMYFFMFLQVAQRGSGDSTTPFWFMALAILLDVTFNPILIRGLGPFPKMGIAGSATATLIGQGVSLLLLVLHLYRKGSVLALKGPELRYLLPDAEILKSLAMRGIPMGLQMLVMSGAAFIMIGFVNHYGALTSAAYAVSSTIWGYVQMPVMAIGASASSMAAQNVGAGRWDRVDRVARAAVLCGLGVTAVIAGALYLFNHQVLSILLPATSPAMPLASHINRMVLWGFILFSVTFSLSGVIRSTGAVLAPLVIMIIAMVGVRVQAAWWLMPIYGADGIWWSFPMGSFTSAVLTAAYYYKGDWRKNRMLKDAPRGRAPEPRAEEEFSLPAAAAADHPEPHPLRS
jgi:putative MATE family efflux protein